MLARIPSAPVLDLADIKSVRQDLVEVAASKGQPADRSAAGRGIGFGREVKADEFGLDPPDVLEFKNRSKIVRTVRASVSLTVRVRSFRS